MLGAGFYVRYAPQSAPVNEITLPIEVYPVDGHSAHVEPVTVYVSNPAGADSLYLQAHQIGYHRSQRGEDEGYDSAADVRINGGAWVPIDNATVTCEIPDRYYECVGGAFPTIRFEVPIAGTGALVSGANTIEFRFNGTDGTRSGYRILDLEVRDGGDRDLIDGTTFSMDDPDTWAPPAGYSNLDSIADGGTLWRKQNLLTEWSLDKNPVVEAPIVASCADCHARSGYDLQYFNYSNRSIVSRSRFHGLSESEGKKIAAYIRSITLDLPGGYTQADAGRPWNPPYQPADGLDDKPVDLWAAGGGLEAVLTHDREMAPHLKDEMAAGRHRIDSEYGLKVRELPVAYQFPDWNNWLPDIAPAEIISNFETTAPYQGYITFRNKTDTPGKVQNLVDATTPCSKFIGGLHDVASNAFDAMVSVHGVSSGPWPADALIAQIWDLSSKQWMGVRFWEIMQKHGLQDWGEEMFKGKCDSTYPYDTSTFLSDRMWPGGGAPLFIISPHMHVTGYPDDGAYPTTFQEVYYSSAWYELQLAVGIGVRGRGVSGGRPMDWNYQSPHIRGATPDGHPQFLRYTRSYLAEIQGKHGLKDQRLFPGLDKTFPFRQTNIGGSTSGLLGGSVRQNWPDRLQGGGDELPQATAKKWLEVAATEFNRKLHKHPIEAWPRCSETGQTTSCFNDSTYVPEPTWNQLEYANSYYRSVYALGPNGHPICEPAPSWYAEPDQPCGWDVRPSLLDSLAQWGEAMWPHGNYEQLMMSRESQTISLQGGGNFVSGFVVPEEVALDSVFEAIASDIFRIEDGRGNTYIPGDETNTIDDWNPLQGYVVYSESSRTLTLHGQVLQPGAHPISLEQGWNVIPFLPQSSLPIDEALSSIAEHIELVKDEEGNSYVPQHGINTIGDMKPGEAYKIYVSQAVDLTYPSP